mmetsp:Transcript_25110/g.37949  ORF Transcript_25110/g.37949 Transcript_25110/m.37949 type:complete len:162 (+) Transcript_25110:183-668(+)
MSRVFLMILIQLVIASAVSGRLSSPTKKIRQLEDGWKNYIPDDDSWRNYVPDDDSWKENWKNYIPDDDGWKSNWNNFGKSGNGDDASGGDDDNSPSYAQTTKQNVSDMYQQSPQYWTASEWITFSLLLVIFGGCFCCFCLCWIIPRCCGKAAPTMAYAAMA